MRKIGVIIILLGLGITVFTTITYFSKKKVADNDIVELSNPNSFISNLSPISGIVIMGIGGILFWQTYNQN